MKPILLLIIFCIACTQASVAQNASDRQVDGFLGPVKKVFVEWLPISGSDYPAGSRCPEMTKVYDQSGRLMRHSLYSGGCGRDEIRNEYSYGTDGSRTEKSQEIRAKNGAPPPGAYTPSILETPLYPETDKGEPRTVVKYDPSSGKRIETAWIRPSGKIVYKTTDSYDNKGRLVYTTGVDSDGQVSSRRVYGYTGDEKVPSTYAYYDGSGKLHERIVYSEYKFNSQGDWIKRTATSLDKYNRTSVYTTVRKIEYYPGGK